MSGDAAYLSIGGLGSDLANITDLFQDANDICGRSEAIHTNTHTKTYHKPRPLQC